MAMAKTTLFPWNEPDANAPIRNNYEYFRSSTKGNGDYFPMGSYKNKDPNTNKETYNKSFLSDEKMSNSTNYNYDPHPSLNTSKFGKGFQRRQANNIINEVKNNNQDYSIISNIKKDEKNIQRTDNIRKKDSLCGYNVITGEKYQHITPHPQSFETFTGKKIINDNLSDYTIKHGQTVLKESKGRYHGPLGTGNNFEYRQKILLNEGISNQRCSSIIELGKKDIVSYGIEDNFSKSQYTTNNEKLHITGLYEARQPGRYTPRKIENHPAGKPNIVKNWTKTIDINNNSMNGKL